MGTSSYAAVGGSTVWGLGETPEAALADAATYLVGPQGEPEPEKVSLLVCHPVTGEQAGEVLSGETAWPIVVRPTVLGSVYAHVGVPVGGTLPSYTSLGSYTILYYTVGHEVACASCASSWTDVEDPVGYADVFYEGEAVPCSGCGVMVESSYGAVEPRKVGT